MLLQGKAKVMGISDFQNVTSHFPLLLWLQGSIEDKFQTLQAQRAQAALADVPETDADGKPLTKKARAALIRAAGQVRLSIECPG